MLVVLSVLVGCAGPGTADDPRPDVVLVVVDTLRADHLSAYGYGRPTSPELEKLDAVVYEHASSPAPWTLPAFGSLLTGELPYHHGAGISTGTENTLHPLPADVPTLAGRLRDAGWHTGAVVTNPYLSRVFGLDRGFDEYDASQVARQGDDWRAASVALARHYRSADQEVDAALDWWRETPSPRFLMVHLMDPHEPRVPPSEDVLAVGGRGGVGGEATAGSADVAKYDAEVHFVDREIARLLGETRPDRAIVTADHGEALGEHEGAYPQDGAPHRYTHGHTVFEELLHVPLFVVGEGRGRVDRLVSTVDVAPTILAWAGLPTDGLDGVPLDRETDRPVVALACRYGAEKRAVRLGSLKLVATPWGESLYDLDADPGETSPVDRPDDAKRLEALLPPLTTGEPVPLDPTTKAALKQLGYAE